MRQLELKTLLGFLCVMAFLAVVAGYLLLDRILDRSLCGVDGNFYATPSIDASMNYSSTSSMSAYGNSTAALQLQYGSAKFPLGGQYHAQIYCRDLELGIIEQMLVLKNTEERQ